MNENCCPLCNFWISDSWARHIVEIGRFGAKAIGKKFVGMIIACPECLPPVVIPKVFK